MAGLVQGAARLRAAIMATARQALQTSSDSRMQPLHSPFRVQPPPSLALPQLCVCFQRASASPMVLCCLDMSLRYCNNPSREAVSVKREPSPSPFGSTPLYPLLALH